jgi:hypothetical protein
MIKFFFQGSTFAPTQPGVSCFPGPMCRGHHAFPSVHPLQGHDDPLKDLETGIEQDLCLLTPAGHRRPSISPLGNSYPAPVPLPEDQVFWCLDAGHSTHLFSSYLGLRLQECLCHSVLVPLPLQPPQAFLPTATGPHGPLMPCLGPCFGDRQVRQINRRQKRDERQ